MPRRDDSPRADLTAWIGESMRLTTFHGPQVEANDEWRHVTGQEPDSSVSKPKSNEKYETGMFNESLLTFGFNRMVGRIDWVLGDAATEDGAPSFATPYLIRRDVLNEVAKRWLTARCPPTDRIAFGAVVLLPVASSELAYRSLSDYLNFDIHDQGASDLTYQINRPRDSIAVNGVRINRMTKWSRARFVKAVRGQENPVTDQYYCRAEIDINNQFTPEGSLPHQRLVDLFGEMVQLADEIIRMGDIS